jgi:hypothetical protein
MQMIDRDEDSGSIRGVFPQAFELRPAEEYLSASWLEFFAASKLHQVAAVAAFLAKTRKVTDRQAFASGLVGEIKEACGEYDQKIRVLHEPFEDNLAYVAIRRYQSDNQELLELLATEAWADITDAKQVVGLIGPWPAAS